MKKTTLKQLKPVFNSILKNIKTRPLMQNILIKDGTLIMSDFETTLFYRESFGLKDGLQNIKTLGLIESHDENIDEYPQLEIATSTNESTKMTTQELEYFLKFSSKEETRPHLSGVVVDSNSIVAVDGHRLVYKGLENEVVDSYIISRNGLQTLLKLLKKHKINDFELLLGSEFTIVRNDLFTLKIRNIQRDFVKWQAVVPVKNKSEFTINNWINFKELKPLFNKNYHAKITIFDGMVNLQIVGHEKSYLIGSSQDVGTEITIGINASYLNDLINKNEVTNFKFNNELSPVKFKNNSGHGVIMPIKL